MLKVSSYTDYRTFRLLPFFDIWARDGFVNFGWLFWEVTVDWD